MNDTNTEKTAQYVYMRRLSDSFFFRDIKNLETDLYGFTVTYLRDGTAVMSGDVGGLMWMGNRLIRKVDFGFPDKFTKIDYFAQRCRMASDLQDIYDWCPEKAVMDIDSRIRSTKNFKYIPERVYVVLEEIRHLKQGAAGKIEMYTMLNECFPGYSWEKSIFGMCYKKEFITKFKILVSVSDLIINQEREDRKLRRGSSHRKY